MVALFLGSFIDSVCSLCQLAEQVLATDMLLALDLENLEDLCAMKSIT